MNVCVKRSRREPRLVEIIEMKNLLSSDLVYRLFSFEEFWEEVSAHEALLARFVEFRFGRVEVPLDQVSAVFPSVAVGE